MALARTVLFGALVSLSFLEISPTQTVDVDAAQFFTKSERDIRRYVYIQIPAGQVLVLKAGDNGKYLLKGRALSIHADQVRVEGRVEIHSFSKDDHGEDKNVQKVYPTDGLKAPRGLDNQNDGHGTTPAQAPSGVQGDAGGTGPSAFPIRLFIGKITGVGEWSLSVDNSGGNGGHGQQGSDGLRGGRGGNGRNRECAPARTPGNGGSGGEGGYGGQGGPGGPGGNGGVIEYTKALCPLIAAKRLFVKAESGGPGEPGKGGRGGAGGEPGTAGSGHTCAGCLSSSCSSGGNGQSEGKGHENEQGPDGPAGLRGKAAKPICSDCSGQTCAPRSSPAVKVTKPSST